MSGKAKSINEAVEKLAIKTMSDEELGQILNGIVNDNLELIKNQGERSIGPLMGIAMKNLRGKISGERISQLLVEKIQKYLDNKNKTV